MAGRRFDRVPEKLAKTIAGVMWKYHSRLLEPTIEVSVKVETFLVYGPRNKDGEQTGPGIKLRGTTAYACIRVSSLEERVAGRADAVMWIDGDSYKSWQAGTLHAIIDHELTHLDLVTDPKTEEVVVDDAGRTKLKLRPHDFEVGWFDEVAERHAGDSIEVRQASTLATVRQMYFPEFEFLPSSSPSRQAQQIRVQRPKFQDSK